MTEVRKRLPWILAGIAGLGLALVLGLGLATGWMVARAMYRSEGSPRIADTASVVTRVTALNQWVTVKYVVEKVVLVEDARWYGESRLLMIAHGVAKAGVDLGRLKPEDVRIRGRTIEITLPRPQIVDVYLDERRTQIVERTTGMLRAFDKDLEQDARRQAVDQIRVGVRESGILRDAEERARAQVAALLGQSGFEGVTVGFR